MVRYRKMQKKIKLFDPFFDDKEETAIRKTLQSRFWASGAGTGNVSKFEKKFNKYIGSNFNVAVNSGTAALHLALSLFDIRDKEVILPSLSFVSTAHAVIYNGGKPVFVDVDPKTMCIEPELIKKSITNKTKIILPVHFAGMACKLNEIIKLCKENNLILVEDAAHAAGTTYEDKKIGRHGSAVCFSFHPVKNLAMPTGGSITLNGKHSKEFFDSLHASRWCGISNRVGVKYDVDHLGWNYYMNEFSAAIGIEQLKKLDSANNKRRKIAKRYFEEIKIETKMPFERECSYHFYWILVKDRDKFIRKMSTSGIETGVHYKPIHKMKFYKDKTNLPITEMVGEHIVSIPTHPNMRDEDVEKVIKLINKFCKDLR